MDISPSFNSSPEARAGSITNRKTAASVATEIRRFGLSRDCKATESNSTLTLDSVDFENCETLPTRLDTRHCTQPPPTGHSQNIPGREWLGGKGMFLTLMLNAGLPVPPFRCIDTGIVQTLENQPLDLSPLLATLGDGHEFPHETASLADMKRWIVQIEPSGTLSNNLSEKQQRWLNALSSFIAGSSCHQQICALPIAATIHTIYDDLRTHLSEPDSPIIVRSSGVAEDSFGNAQAGKYESLVHGGHSDIVVTCLKVLASTCRPAVFSQQAPQKMAIILQKSIQCRVGGVAMSYRGIDDDTLVIEYGPGQPKAVVSGQYGIKPHCYEIKRNGEQWEALFKPGSADSGFILHTNEKNEYVEEWTKFDSDAEAFARIDSSPLNTLIQGEKILINRLMVPLDFEFAIDQDNKAWFVQVRPITSLPGGNQFSVAFPTTYLNQGVPVSDGCGSGSALAINSPVNASDLPENVVLFCDHGGDWLLTPEVLAKTKAVVLKKGARNDHISISLRQASIPCMLVDKPQWWPESDSPEQVTLVCGRFQGQLGGFLLLGDREQELLSRCDNSAGPDYQMALAISQAWQPTPPEKEASVAYMFSWLSEQNSRLLNFLGTERFINLCLSKNGAVQLSMHPKRSEILHGCAQEIRNFLQETKAFLSGYQQFLILGASADQKLEQAYREEIVALRHQLALVQAKVEHALTEVTRPFLSAGELPAPDSDFKQWQGSCELLKNHLQRLESVNHVNRIGSVHELILWLHKCFLTRLWPVAVASGQGEATNVFTTEFCPAKSKYCHIVDFSTSQEQPLFNDTCHDALRRFSADCVTVLNMPDCTRLSIQLQRHACTIDLLEQADGGKQRSFRLCYSEQLAGISKKQRHGKYLRLWFLTQTLSHYQKHSGFTAPEIHFNEQTGQVLLEFTHLRAKKDLQRMFVDVLSLLQKLKNIDIYLWSLNLDESQTQWNMAAIRERLNNPAFSATNHSALEHIYWSVAFNEGISLVSRCTEDKALRHLVEAALIFSKASVDVVEALLDGESESNRQTLLWHFLLSHPDRAEHLVNKYFNWLADETTAMRLVSQNGYILKYLTPEIRNLRTIVFVAIKSHPNAIADAPECFRNDFDIMNFALANTENNIGIIIKLIGSELLANPELFRQLLITAVKNQSWTLNCDATAAYLKQTPHLYRELLLLALEQGKKDDSYLLHAPSEKENLLNDDSLYRELALKVVEKGDRLRYFPDLNNDREIVYTAVGYAPWALQYAGREFQADKVLVKEAVEKMGGVLVYANEEFHDDREIVLAAVKNDGRALKYASERLRADPIIVAAALDNAGGALQYADERFKHDPYYVRLAVTHYNNQYYNPGYLSYDYLDNTLRDKKELLTIAVSKDPNNFRLANQALRDDKELAQLAVQANGEILLYVSSRLRYHESVVRLAVQNNGNALAYASRNLRANKELVRLAVQNSGQALEFASEQLKDCREVVKLALQQNPLALKFAGDTCRNDPDLVDIALQNNGNALQYVGRSLQNEPQIIAAAVNSIGAFAVSYIQQFIIND